ncbi:MAG: EcsC family protein [Desulfobacteraceae bacterium]|jgi:hypothetical protein
MEVKMPLSSSDMADLAHAKTLLENPSLAAKMTALIGTPIEKSMDFLPPKLSAALQKSTMTAMRSALRFALFTMGRKMKPRAANRFHKGLAAACGGVGGAFGLPALVAEIPLSTVVMLRSIADIARSEGEMVGDIRVRLACLEVFALSGRTGADDAADTGYFAVRAALAQSISEAAKYIAEKGVADKGAPALVRLIAQIAARFNVAVSQKVAAQTIPLIGAAGGLLINMIFIDHFQKMARGHFIIRRLERKYDKIVIREAYDALDIRG